MQTKIIRLPEVKAETGYRSHASIYNAIKAGTFTKPVAIGQRSVGWPAEEVRVINMARIEYAKTRLRAGDPIADVGYQAGFADQSHFHKTFVSYTAATPRQYAHSRSISDNK